MKFPKNLDKFYGAQYALEDFEVTVAEGVKLQQFVINY